MLRIHGYVCSRTEDVGGGCDSNLARRLDTRCWHTTPPIGHGRQARDVCFMHAGGAHGDGGPLQLALQDRSSEAHARLEEKAGGAVGVAAAHRQRLLRLLPAEAQPHQLLQLCLAAAAAACCRRRWLEQAAGLRAAGLQAATRRRLLWGPRLRAWGRPLRRGPRLLRRLRPLRPGRRSHSAGSPPRQLTTEMAQRHRLCDTTASFSIPSSLQHVVKAVNCASHPKQAQAQVEGHCLVAPLRTSRWEARSAAVQRRQAIAGQASQQP